MIKNIFKKLTLSGVAYAKDHATARSIVFFNTMLLIFACISSLYLLFFSILNLFVLAFIILIYILSLFFNIYLNRLGRTRFATFLHMINSNITIFFVSAFLGPKGDAMFFYLCLIPFFFILMINESKPVKIIYIVTQIILIIILEFFGYQYFQIPTIPSEFYRVISLSVYVVSALVLVSTMEFYVTTLKYMKHTLSQVLKIYPLTEREVEIIAEVIKGSSNKEVGNALYIEEDTVKKHLQSIYKKMNIKNRASLIASLTNQ